MTVEASPERVHQAADILQSHMQPVLMGDKAGVKLDVWLSAEIGPHVSGRKVRRAVKRVAGRLGL